MRPWIGHDSKLEVLHYTVGVSRLELDLKNYGSLPAEKCKVVIRTANRPILRNDAYTEVPEGPGDDIPWNSKVDFGVMMPGMIRHLFTYARSSSFPTQDTDPPLYVCTLIDYEYGEKKTKGTTGVIFMAQVGRREFMIDDSWAT